MLDTQSRDPEYVRKFSKVCAYLNGHFARRRSLVQSSTKEAKICCVYVLLDCVSVISNDNEWGRKFEKHTFTVQVTIPTSPIMVLMVTSLTAGRIGELSAPKTRINWLKK